MPSDIAEMIRQTAQSLGISPIDLGTAISYETGGTFDPMKRGPTTQWGQHRGLIQFGEPQARQFGVDWAHPLESQLGPEGAVAKYLRSTGVKPGMGLMDVYSAINAGGVGRNGASDANNGGAPGTVADKVNNQMGAHRRNAYSMMGVPDGPKGQETFTPPGATIQGAPGVDMGAQPAPQGAPDSTLGRIFAAFGGAGGSMLSPTEATSPTMARSTGDMATMAAQQGAEQAKMLAGSLAPDVSAYLGLGGQRKMFG